MTVSDEVPNFQGEVFMDKNVVIYSVSNVYRSHHFNAYMQNNLIYNCNAICFWLFNITLMDSAVLVFEWRGFGDFLVEKNGLV